MFGIRCYRSAGSIFGAAEAWLRGADGRPQAFETEDAARAEARRISAATTSVNVSYQAAPFVTPADKTAFKRLARDFNRTKRVED